MVEGQFALEGAMVLERGAVGGTVGIPRRNVDVVEHAAALAEAPGSLVRREAGPLSWRRSSREASACSRSCLACSNQSFRTIRHGWSMAGAATGGNGAGFAGPRPTVASRSRVVYFIGTARRAWERPLLHHAARPVCVRQASYETGSVSVLLNRER